LFSQLGRFGGLPTGGEKNGIFAPHKKGGGTHLGGLKNKEGVRII